MLKRKVERIRTCWLQTSSVNFENKVCMSKWRWRDAVLSDDFILSYIDRSEINRTRWLLQEEKSLIIGRVWASFCYCYCYFWDLEFDSIGDTYINRLSTSELVLEKIKLSWFVPDDYYRKYWQEVTYWLNVNYEIKMLVEVASNMENFLNVSNFGVIVI